MVNNVLKMFIVLKWKFYNIIKFLKYIIEKVHLVVLHGLANIDGVKGGREKIGRGKEKGMEGEGGQG